MAPNLQRHLLDFQNSPLGNTPAGYGIKGKAQGIRHHSAQVADPQFNPGYPCPAIGTGFLFDDLKETLGYGKFMHT